MAATSASIISIHDVMPSTLEDVQQLLHLADNLGIQKVTLLVVPGLEWVSADIERLRRWEDQGYRLAGHGWLHRCHRIRGINHRLHSWLISRDVAEHLDWGNRPVSALMQRCAEWFDDHGFEVPALYVPPAWAMGEVGQEELARLPFCLYETLAGVYSAKADSTRLLPLVGFEADNFSRQVALKMANQTNCWLATLANRPLRVALHPHDLRLRLHRDITRIIARFPRGMNYDDLFGY